MIRIFTRLYIRQLRRVLLEIGLWRRIVVAFIFFIFLLGIIQKVSIYSAGISLGVFLSILSLHFQRPDRQFVKVVNINEKLLFFVHYHLLAFAIYVILCVFQEFIPFLLLFIGISLIPLLTFSVKWFSFKSFDLLQYLRIKNFEFKSGLRKNKYILLGLYVLALFFFKYAVVAFCVILVFSLIATSFYNEAEPCIMLEVYQLPPGKFLINKIKNHLKDFWTLCLPLIIIFLSRLPEYWYIMVALLIISSIIQSLSICLKYSFYEPGKSLYNSIFMIIYVLSIFIIFFIPVPLVMLVYYSRKAKQNLNNYLYDYH